MCRLTCGNTGIARCVLVEIVAHYERLSAVRHSPYAAGNGESQKRCSAKYLGLRVDEIQVPQSYHC